MPKNFQNLSLVMLFMSLASACSSHYGMTKIISSPPGAQVILDDGTNDGLVIGVTPTVYSRKDSSDIRRMVILRLKKEGYYDKTSPFWMTMSFSSEEEAKENSQLLEIELQERVNQ